MAARARTPTRVRGRPRATRPLDRAANAAGRTFPRRRAAAARCRRGADHPRRRRAGRRGARPRTAPARSRLAARHRLAAAGCSARGDHGHLEMVRLLLDLGADVDERTMLESSGRAHRSSGPPLWLARPAPDGAISPNCCSTAAPTPTPILTPPAGRSTAPIERNDDAMKQLLLATRRQATALDGRHRARHRDRTPHAGRDPSEDLAPRAGLVGRL